VALRIGLISPPWLPVPPPKYGGTEAIVDRLARGLLARGHDVTVFCTGDSTCAAPRRWVFDAAQRAQLGQVVTELQHVIAAYDALRDCDIVHDHCVVGPMYAERFPRLPVVTTAHGPFQGGLEDIYRAIGPRVPIVAISQHQASTAGMIPVAAVIHHGVDPEAFTVGRGDGGYFAWLGRMAPYKGASTAAAVARRAGVRLRMAAKIQHDDEVAFFAAEVEPLLGDGVEYIGEVDAAQRDELLGGARGLLNPISWDEPFGLVMIEALACGTPVIAFPGGAAPEIIDHGITGFLCADAAEMVARIAQVDELDRAACRKAVEAYFCTDRMVDEHLAFYQRVLDSRRTINLSRQPAPTSAAALP